jgi:hypothetical protein
MTHQERIKDEAEAYANNEYGEYASNINDFGYPVWKHCVATYIAGATAEREQFKPVIDALEEIAARDCDYETVYYPNTSNYSHTLHSPNCRACNAKEALEQWKGKEKKPEPTVSNCGMCGKEGINQYLGNQFYLCEECFYNYENSRDQP